MRDLVDVASSSYATTSSYIGYIDGYVKHAHQRHGLGNVLFMINAALACGGEAVLVNTSNVLLGTSRAFGRRRTTRPYTSTLLRRFRLVQRRPRAVSASLRGGHGAFASAPVCPNSSFIVRTFAQSPHFAASVPTLLRRLAWPSPSQLELPPSRAAKYAALLAGGSRGTCVGVRAGRDFAHRPISAAQYAIALSHLRSLGERIQPLFVLGDVEDAWSAFEPTVGEPATQIDEDDVTQLALSRHCRNFVVSQSSFHVWMAYAAVKPRHVLIFNGTDPINTGLYSPRWMARPWLIL